jgi:hypothetical protein
VSAPATTTLSPADTSGLRFICSSTEFQAHREADVIGVPVGSTRQRYVRVVLKRRQDAEEERAKKRSRERQRWEGIAGGFVTPPTTHDIGGGILGPDEKPGAQGRKDPYIDYHVPRSAPRG